MTRKLLRSCLCNQGSLAHLICCTCISHATAMHRLSCPQNYMLAQDVAFTAWMSAVTMPRPQYQPS